MAVNEEELSLYEKMQLGTRPCDDNLMDKVEKWLDFQNSKYGTAACKRKHRCILMRYDDYCCDCDDKSFCFHDYCSDWNHEKRLNEAVSSMEIQDTPDEIYTADFFEKNEKNFETYDKLNIKETHSRVNREEYLFLRNIESCLRDEERKQSKHCPLKHSCRISDRLRNEVCGSKRFLQCIHLYCCRYQHVVVEQRQEKSDATSTY